MSVLLIGFLLAAVFLGLNAIIRARADDRSYKRVAILSAAIIILVAWGLFAATQLGFIPNHAP